MSRLDIRAGHYGGDWPLQGDFRLRFNAMLNFLGHAVSEERGICRGKGCAHTAGQREPSQGRGSPHPSTTKPDEQDLTVNSMAVTTRSIRRGLKRALEP